MSSEDEVEPGERGADASPGREPAAGAEAPTPPDAPGDQPVDVATGPWVRVLVAVALTVLVGLVLTAVVALQDDDDSAGPVTLDEATDARVQLPGGIPAVARPGMSVPHGSVIVTGPEGSVRAGDVEMGADQVGRVIDGRLLLSPPVSQPGPAAGG